MLLVVKHTVKHSVKHCNQKLTVVQLQEKQHVHEKEMQRQKLQQEKKLQQDVDVVHQQKDLQEEELLGDLPHEEGDVNLLSFFYSNLAKSFPIMCCCSLNTTYMIYLLITNNM